MSFAQVTTGRHDANHAIETGEYRFYTCAYDYTFCNSCSFSGECLILPGNGANVGEVFYYNGKFDAYQRTYVIHNIKNIKPKYLYYYFKANWKIVGVAQQFGAATNYIKIGNFEDFKIRVYSENIQQKIVEELDYLTSIIEKLKKQLEELDNLTQSIFYDMFGDPIENEKGWGKEKITKVAPIEPYQGDIPEMNGMYWLLNLDMIQSNKRTIYEKVYVQYDEVGTSTIKFNKDNVLYSKLRPYLNKVVIPDESGFCTSELVPFKPNESIILKIFLCYVLSHKCFVDYINSKVIGAKMPRVSMNVLREFNVITPPLPLQQQFAAKIEAIEKQKELIKKSIKETEDLFNSRMDYYFN